MKITKSLSKNTSEEIILAIDTSTPQLSVALYKNKKIFELVTQQNFPDYAENLIPMVDKLLKKSDTKLKDITSVGCNIGPGSFTGLRIGLSFVKTLSQELKTKIFVSNTFYMCLTNFLNTKKSLYTNFQKFSVITLISAVKSEVYYKKFVIKKNSIVQSSKNLCIKKSNLKSKIKPEENVFVIGNAIDKQLLEFVTVKPKNMIPIFPKAKDLIDIYFNTNLSTTVSLTTLSPLYIRHTYY
jgi:tRNA threonylcarbamoyl adenosine modification protein YeaZ